MMLHRDELNVRILVRRFCKPIETDKGVSQDELEEIAVWEYEQGYQDGVHDGEKKQK